MRFWGPFLCLVVLATRGAGGAVKVPAAEALRPPSTAWVRMQLQGPAHVGWPEIEGAASDAALQAEAGNRTDAMTGWLLVARWARLLGTNQQTLTDRWTSAINTARLGHANMPRNYAAPAEPLSAVLTADFAVALLGDREFSLSFFDQLTPYDYLPRVLAILDTLHSADPATFAEYQELALAIALVFDVPPPPQWPHGQVAAALLPRQLPDPVVAFAFWTESDRRHVTLQSLRRLSARELKFVVDAAAPLPDLRWAQAQVRFDFAGLPRAYDAVAYRPERAERLIYQWPGPSYALPAILAEGGICVDQAYFASQVGKARGVPTLLFRGAGLDGRHAWFGYLDGRQQWQFDVGRYAEQKLVVGLALDPQTWGEVNDHELAFLAERFRLLPTYRQSRARQLLAQEYLRHDDAAGALREAQRAVNYEPRNVGAWETLLLAQRGAGVAPLSREATLRQAARAFARYPDLQGRFLREVIAVLRERGQTSAAEHEEQQLVRRFTADRNDLAVAQAAELLNRSLADDDGATQLRVFESALRQFGVSAGMLAFDRLVAPSFRQALREGRLQDAGMVLGITARLLPIDPQSQFAKELAALEDALRKAVAKQR